MEMHDGGLLYAIEHSGLGTLARQSVWLYPAANVGHILALTIFVGSVMMMDARLLGAFRDVAPGVYLGRVRTLAIAGFLGMIITGSVLFAAEATHVATNPVFRLKLVLIALGLANALFFELFAARGVRTLPARIGTPFIARLSAVVSLIVWFSVAAAGRLIAYF
jgi:hypothetical protein